MPTLAILSAYLLVGMLLGRLVFVSTLGDAERVFIHARNGTTSWSAEFLRAAWWTFFVVFGWPLFLPLRLVFGTTPHEKTVKRRAEMKQLSEEMRALEERFDLKFNPERMGK